MNASQASRPRLSSRARDSQGDRVGRCRRRCSISVARRAVSSAPNDRAPDAPRPCGPSNPSQRPGQQREDRSGDHGAQDDAVPSDGRSGASGSARSRGRPSGCRSTRRSRLRKRRKDTRAQYPTRRASQRRGSGSEPESAWWALCISLCTGVHSARPLIPCVGRGWWGAWIRPRPPYVTIDGGGRGRIQSPQEVVVEGSADGREVVQGQNNRETEEEERQQKQQRQATSTATANGETKKRRARRREDGARRQGEASRSVRRVVGGGWLSWRWCAVSGRGGKARGPGRRSFEALRVVGAAGGRRDRAAGAGAGVRAARDVLARRAARAARAWSCARLIAAAAWSRSPPPGRRAVGADRGDVRAGATHGSGLRHARAVSWVAALLTVREREWLSDRELRGATEWRDPGGVGRARAGGTVRIWGW